MKIKFTKKNIALALLLVPILFLIAFAIGEGLSPDFGISGFILHFVQALPLIVVFGICIKWPKVGGKILIFGSVLLAFIFVFVGQGPILMRLVWLVQIFSLPLISGFLLLRSKSS